MGTAAVANSDDNHAFVYSEGVMKDLNSLILNPIDNVVLTGTSGVNDSGQIIANGLLNDSAAEAFILNPVSIAAPEPSSAALTVLGLMAAIVAVRR